MVPIVAYPFELPKENLVENMIAMADGKSLINYETDREGIVVRGLQKDFSFKAISNVYLLKN